MTISLARDFIYYSQGKEATLIMRHECEHSCTFCPARELKPMRDADEILKLLKSDMPLEITIYGGACGSYLTRLLRRYEQIQENFKIKLETCCTDIDRPLSAYNKFLVDFVCLSDTVFHEYSKILFAAAGDPLQTALKVLEVQKKFQTELEPKITEAPLIFEESYFWSDSQFKEFKKNLNDLKARNQNNEQDYNGI